jgi:hypothetical protein
VSFWVQASKSSHGVPSVFASSTHAPVLGTHRAVRHCPVAKQAVPPMTVQTPLWQTEVSHLLISSQGVLSAFGSSTHAPVLGSQTAAATHSPVTKQAVPPITVQAPSRQTAVLHLLPSEQGVLSAFDA